jgi:hypothetical protein
VRTYDYYDARSPKKITHQTETSKVMVEIEQNYRAAVKDQVTPVFKRSTAPRPVSRTENFFLQVRKYVKPSDPGSVWSKQASYISVDEPNATNESGNRQERQRKRRSMVSASGSIQRSPSRDRDGGESGQRASRMCGGTFGKRRSQRKSRGMPTSPGLDKYNRAIGKEIY